MESINNDALIAEYNTIKDELRVNEEHRNTLLIFTYTSVGAILSFSIQSQNPYIALVTFFMLICVKCRIIYYRDIFMVRYSYIKYVLEKKLQIDACSAMEKIKTSKISKIQYFSFSIMGFGGILVYLINNPHNHTTLIILSILLASILYLDTYYIYSLKPLSKKIKDIYKNL